MFKIREPVYSKGVFIAFFVIYIGVSPGLSI